MLCVSEKNRGNMQIMMQVRGKEKPASTQESCNHVRALNQADGMEDRSK